MLGVIRGAIQNLRLFVNEGSSTTFVFYKKKIKQTNNVKLQTIFFLKFLTNFHRSGNKAAKTSFLGIQTIFDGLN